MSDENFNYLQLIKKIKRTAKNILKCSPAISFDHFYDEICHMPEMRSRAHTYDNITLNLKESTIIEAGKFQINKKTKSSFIKIIQSFDKKTIEHETNFQMFSITIIGAGLAGLLAAKNLENHNTKITILERRTKEEALSRYFVIVIRDVELFSAMVGKEAMDFILKHGGIFEKETKMLKAPISIIQQGIIASLSSEVQIRFNQKVNTLEDLDETDLCIVAAGSQSVNKLKLSKYFTFLEFNQYATKIKEMLCLEPSNKTPTYWRNFFPGKNWVVMSVTVDAVQKMYNELKKNLNSSIVIDELTKSLLDTLKSSLHHDTISLTRIKSAHTVTLEDIEPFYQKIYDVTPSITLNQVYFSEHNMPIILLGDATGSVHPITISGAKKYIRVIPILINFINTYRMLKKLNNIYSSDNSILLYSKLHKLFEYSTKDIIEDVFFRSVSFCLYSELDR